ncbi:MAG: hypothetical protein ABSE63_01690 [Thermoguttaceae bacterium]
MSAKIATNPGKQISFFHVPTFYFHVPTLKMSELDGRALTYGPPLDIRAKRAYFMDGLRTSNRVQSHSAFIGKGCSGRDAMDDRIVEKIWNAVQKFLIDNWEKFNPKNPEKIINPWELFEEMVNSVGQKVPEADAPTEYDFRMVVAMCWLGPDFHGFPLRDIRKDLLSIVEKSLPDESARAERVFEFVIAYGCGWGRQPLAGHGTWEHRWQNAITVVGQLMCTPVKEVDKWLITTLIKYTGAVGIVRDASFLAAYLAVPAKTLTVATDEHFELHRLEDETIAIITSVSTKDYFNPQHEPKDKRSVPLGARLVFTFPGTMQLHEDSNTVRPIQITDPRISSLCRDDDTWIIYPGPHNRSCHYTLKPGQWLEIAGPAELIIWECTCVNNKCQHQHRIANWNQDMLLLNFIFSAVKGPGRVLKEGVVVEGMYIPMLTWRGEPRVREAEIARTICPKDHVFHGNNCLECCKKMDDLRQIRTVSHRGLIVEANPPAYKLVEMIRCSNKEEHYCCIRGFKPNQQITEKLGEDWDNLYPFPTDPMGEQAKCPICDSSPERPPKPTRVWVRSHLRAVELDDFLLPPNHSNENKDEDGNSSEEGSFMGDLT